MKERDLGDLLETATREATEELGESSAAGRRKLDGGYRRPGTPHQQVTAPSYSSTCTAVVKYVCRGGLMKHTVCAHQLFRCKVWSPHAGLIPADFDISGSIVVRWAPSHITSHPSATHPLRSSSTLTRTDTTGAHR